MTDHVDPERAIYPTLAHFAWNQVLFPVRMVVPQPIIRRIPGLMTNEDVRTRIVARNARGRLLDVGCGGNRLVREYRARGGDGIGVDVYGWPGVDVLVGDSSDLPFESESFDTISFVASLNHIPNRREVLAEAHRLLRPSGRLLVTMLHPAVSRLWHLYAYWDEDQHERGMGDGEVFSLGSRTVRALLDETGFSIDARVAFSWGLNALYVCSRRPEGPTRSRPSGPPTRPAPPWDMHGA